MNEFFVSFNFKKETLLIIQQANEIIEEYQADGYDLTLRQLYYQFVARDILPNSQQSYNRLGSIINDARLNGDIDWSAIKDRTRELGSNLHWESPSERIYYAARNYEINTREDQDYYVEVWVEKEALAGVVERVCRELDVPWFACRGYVSQTSMYEAAKRFGKHDQAVILHLGDHDPSGMDMTRDISERLNNAFRTPVNVKRIALNIDQIAEHEPPPNPAKFTDSRCRGYIKEYGEHSWELDALNPRVLHELIESTVVKYTDEDKRQARIWKGEQEKGLLQQCSRKWGVIEAGLKDGTI